MILDDEDDLSFRRVWRPEGNSATRLKVRAAQERPQIKESSAQPAHYTAFDLAERK